MAPSAGTREQVHRARRLAHRFLAAIALPPTRLWLASTWAGAEQPARPFLMAGREWWQSEHALPRTPTTVASGLRFSGAACLVMALRGRWDSPQHSSAVRGEAVVEHQVSNFAFNSSVAAGDQADVCGVAEIMLGCSTGPPSQHSREILWTVASRSSAPFTLVRTRGCAHIGATKYRLWAGCRAVLALG